MDYLKKFLAITLIFVMQFQSVHASVAIGGGWGLDKPVVNGATITWEAVKNGARSTVAISPSSAQVVKSLLRGGLIGLALTAVTQALLDGIDFVMDSAKQELRYKTANCGHDGSSCPSSRYFYFAGGGWGKLGFFSSINTLLNKLSASAQNYYPDSRVTKVEFFEYADNDPSKLQGCPGYFKISYNDKYGDGKDFSEVCRSYNNFYNSSAKPDIKTLSLTTLATQIINLAEQGNPEAKAYIASVVQDMLEHDEDYRKSLEAQLDAKLKEATQTKTPDDDCPSGIYSDLGQCWVCDKSDHEVVTQRTQLAKKELSRLGKCKPEMENSELFKRINTFNEFIQARVNENSCWSPMDPKHIQQEQDGRNGVAKCKKYLR